MSFTPPVHLRSGRTLGVLSACGLAALTLASATSAQQVQNPRLEAPLPEAVQGRAAIQSLGTRLADVARDNGMSAAELADELLRDHTLWIDGSDRLFYVDEAPPASPDDTFDPTIFGIDPPSIPTSEAFLLHSRPGADHVIYLDFDGHHSVNNSWGHNIMFPAFDTNGDPSTFSNNELLSIIAHWQFVAEDFAPFEVDVTTEEPPIDYLTKSGSGDQEWGVRCVHTQATSGFGNGIGGVAFLNSFDDSLDNPVFAFNKGNNNGGMTGSHEVGHALGLSHDGLNGSAYHPGTGNGGTSWGPIMGAPFGKKLVQWSNGDYTGSTNTQNDVNIITKTANGITTKVDDHGDDLATATFIDVGCPDPQHVCVAGLIERRMDVDAFTFTSLGGVYTIEADVAPVGRNLDILLEVYDDLGALVASENQAGLPHASVTLTLAPGDYLVTVDGVGKGTTYSDYGSLGEYTMNIIPEHGFTDLGFGLPGTGTPLLSGTGFACTGNLVSVDMTGGLPNTLALLAYSQNQVNLPLKGGTLVPNIGGPGGVLTLATDANGDVSVSQAWPATISGGANLFFQYWQPDAGGPQGWAATNATVITAP